MMNQILDYKQFRVGRVGGAVYRKKNTGQKPVLVVFNQWRSGAASIFSKFLAEMVLDRNVYSSVMFIDRIASGGSSDNTLTKTEKEKMHISGDYLFGKNYAKAIHEVLNSQKLPNQYVLAGSSAGSPAAIACLNATSPVQQQHIMAVTLVEPGGLRKHGFGKKGYGGTTIAFTRHLAAYRHRIKRGWWTPMDKEQYFAKGKMFEHRANWWAGDFVFRQLCVDLANRQLPPINIVLSKDSHIHNNKIRQALKACAVKPHKIIEITGNHDKICQPPSLSQLYTKYFKLMQ